MECSKPNLGHARGIKISDIQAEVMNEESIGLIGHEIMDLILDSTERWKQLVWNRAFVDLLHADGRINNEQRCAINCTKTQRLHPCTRLDPGLQERIQEIIQKLVRSKETTGRVEASSGGESTGAMDK